MPRLHLHAAALLAAALFSLAAVPAAARAPDTFEEMYSPPTVIESPEHFQLELKIGPYTPDAGSAYREIFGGNSAWLLGLELDVNLVRIPYVGTVGIGAGWGWGRVRGRTLSGNQRTEERAQLTLYPLSALGVLRVDALVRHLNIPVMLTGKIGADFVRWKSEAGSRTEATGISPGLRWAAQAALDLNFAEPSAARSLDEQWGINRTFLLFEYYGSYAEGKSLPLRDTTFSLGLGLMF